MNFEEIHKKYYNQSDDEDSVSLASSASDVSFTKKEVKVETSILSNKSDDTDSLQELIKSMEKTDSLKLDESLKEKVNEIIESLQETDSSSSDTKPKLDESLNESEKSEADLKKVADNLDNSQLNESVAESENDSEMKQVAKNLEAALNDSLNDVEDNLAQQKEQEEGKDLIAKLGEGLSSRISATSDTLTEIVGEIFAKTEAKPETPQPVDDEPPSALAQIMQLVTGMTRLSDENLDPEDDQIHDDSKEEWQYVDPKAQYDASFEYLNKPQPAKDAKQEANESKESEDLNASVEEPEIARCAPFKESEPADDQSESNSLNTTTDDLEIVKLEPVKVWASSEQKDELNESVSQELNVSSEEPVIANCPPPRQPAEKKDELNESVSEELNASSEEPVIAVCPPRRQSTEEEHNESISEDASNQEPDIIKCEPIKELVSALAPSEPAEDQNESLKKDEIEMVKSEIVKELASSFAPADLKEDHSESLNTTTDEPEVIKCVKELASSFAPADLKEDHNESLNTTTDEPEVIESVNELASSFAPAEHNESISSEVSDKSSDDSKVESQQVSSEQPKELEVEVPDAIERISDALTKLAQNLVEPKTEQKPDLVLVNKEISDAEVRLTYQDADGQKFEAIGCKLFKPDDVLFRKEEILNKYKLTDEQFDLCREFFNEKKEDSLLNNRILRVLMKEAVKSRAQVKASEEDVDRALEAIDENKDDKITFDEFVQLLLLFFSSKNNVENRVSNVLQAKLSSETLSANDAFEFANFLSKFYGRKENSDEFKDGLNVTDFLKNLLPSLGQLAFVQPEDETKESEKQAEN